MTWAFWRHSNGTRSLTHSLTHRSLINLFVKARLNTLPLPYLADQARTIKVNEWLSEVEIEEIKRKLSQERVEYQMTGSVGSRPDQQGNEEMCETERIEDGLDQLNQQQPTGDVSRGSKSATQRQKFNTDDEKSVRNPVISADWKTEYNS